MSKTINKIARYRALAKAEKEFNDLADRAQELTPRQRYSAGMINDADKLSIECQIRALEISEQRAKLKGDVDAWLYDFKDPLVRKSLKRFLEGDSLETAVRSVTKNNLQFDLVSGIVAGIIKNAI